MEDLNGSAPEQTQRAAVVPIVSEAMPALLDSRQAAKVLNVNPRTVTRLCERGKLKAVRVASRWRINRDALLADVGLAPAD